MRWLLTWWAPRGLARRTWMTKASSVLFYFIFVQRTFANFDKLLTSYVVVCFEWADPMDFSGMSLIKLKKEEMESQVSCAIMKDDWKQRLCVWTLLELSHFLCVKLFYNYCDVDFILECAWVTFFFFFQRAILTGLKELKWHILNRNAVQHLQAHAKYALFDMYDGF